MVTKRPVVSKGLALIQHAGILAKSTFKQVIRRLYFYKVEHLTNSKRDNQIQLLVSPLTFPFSPQKSANFVYCPLTGFAVGEKQSEFEGWAFQFPGVFLLEDFISTNEEYQMVELMDRNTWKPSQSGRRKQVFSQTLNSSLVWEAGMGSSFSVYLWIALFSL